MHSLIHKLDPEFAHSLLVKKLKLGLYKQRKSLRIAQRKVFGVTFPNYMGVAAGFDKNAEIFPMLLDMGFGFVEVGTLTPNPQEGNPKPRIEVDVKNRTIWNSMGLNNCGYKEAIKRIRKYRDRISSEICRSGDPVKVSEKYPGKIGVSIAPDPYSSNPIQDLQLGVCVFCDYVDYITLNISCPNVKNSKFTFDQLKEVLEFCKKNMIRCPILLKISPNMSHKEDKMLLEIIDNGLVDGLVISNSYSDPFGFKGGGFSGRKIGFTSSSYLRKINGAMSKDKRVPIIACGGIFDKYDVYDRITKGASLFQVYSALVFRGIDISQEFIV